MGIRSRPFPRAIGSPASCLLCQWRAFASSSPRNAEKPPTPSKVVSTPDPTDPSGPLASAPRPYGKQTKNFTPTPLSRPIGMSRPPQAGENTGIDNRTLVQRRADFVDYGKHLERRKELYEPITRLPIDVPLE